MSGTGFAFAAGTSEILSFLKEAIYNPVFKVQTYLQDTPKITIDYKRMERIIEANLEVVPGGKLGRKEKLLFGLPKYGYYESIRAWDLNIDNPLDLTIKFDFKEEDVKINFHEPRSVSKIKFKMKIYITDENWLSDVVTPNVEILRESYFNFFAEVTITNNTDHFIKNYEISIPVKKYEFGSSDLKILRKQQERSKDSQKEARFKKEIENKMKSISYDEFIKILNLIYDEESSSWSVKPHDINFPQIKDSFFNRKGFTTVGKFIFRVDLKPSDVISYRVLGPDITRIMEQEAIKELKKNGAKNW